MNIQKNHVVTLHYRLHEDHDGGELIEETFGGEPLSFIFGVGMMLPMFEENLENKILGDTFDFTLQPEDAYGEYQDEAVVELSIETFRGADGEIDRTQLVEGTPVNMQDHEGRTYRGVILEPKMESVIVDFNHPMSGRVLHFSGEVVEVRPATDSELDHGHVHPGGLEHD
jgi:FKBP-type peptidyl-prolyl cis-trans isomerase SlyD